MQHVETAREIASNAKALVYLMTDSLSVISRLFYHAACAFDCRRQYTDAHPFERRQHWLGEKFEAKDISSD